MKCLITDKLKTGFEGQTLKCYLYTETMEEAEKIAHYTELCCEISELEDTEFISETDYKFCVTWEGTEAIDLLKKLNKQDIFANFLAPISSYQTLKTKFTKTRDDAVTPTRAHSTDSGFDITIIDIHKTVGDVTFYKTGITVEPPHGYYFELVPRSSISKTGYMLANNIGIIDQNYRGEILVALRKTDKQSKDIELPMKIAQLIPKQWYNMEFEEVTKCSDTQRSEGGFGSTN